MTDAGLAGSVSVAITGNLTPFEQTLAKAEALATAFNARVEAVLAGAGGSSSAFTATTQSATEASAAISRITAPAAAASAAIETIGTAAITAAGGVDAASYSNKDLAAALAATGNNLQKALALMTANAEASGVMADATAAAARSEAAMAEATGASAGASVDLAAATARATAATVELGVAQATTTKLTAGVTREFTVLGAEIARGNLSRIPSSLLVLNERLLSTGTGVLTLKNAMGALGGLAEVIFNPYVLGFLAITLGLDAAVHGLEALAGSGKSAADVLKENDQWIKSIASSFPDAEAAAKSYADAVNKIPTVVAQDQAKSQTDALRARLNSSLHDISGYFDLFQLAQQKAPNTLAGGGSDVLSALKTFENGGTLTDLQKTLANLHLSSALGPDIKSMVDGLQDSVKGALDLQHSIDGDGVAADRLTEAYQRLAIAAAERKDELAATDSITKSLQFQISTLGQSNAAVAAAKEYQEVWNKGIEQGRSDLQELSAQASSAAGEVAGLTSAFIAANANSDLKFSISMVGLSTAQQAAAKALRAPGQTDAAAVLGQPGASDTVVKDTLNEFISLTKKADPASKAAAADLEALGKSGAIPAATMAILNQRLKDYTANTTHAAKAPKFSPYDQALQSAKSDTANLAAQYQALGLTAEAADKLTESQKLLNEATKKGTDLSGPQLAAIDAAATAYAEQKAQLAALTDLYNTGQEETEDFFSTLKTSLQNGESVWQSFGDAASKVLDDLADKALQFASDGIWNSIFGAAGGSSGGGIIGSILGAIGLGGGSGLQAGAGLKWAGLPAYASGTNSALGGLSLIGENGPELMNVPRGAQVFTAPQTRQMLGANSNAANVNISLGNTTINGSGLSADQLSAVLATHGQQQIDRINRQIVPVVHKVLGIKPPPGQHYPNAAFG